MVGFGCKHHEDWRAYIVPIIFALPAWALYTPRRGRGTFCDAVSALSVAVFYLILLAIATHVIVVFCRAVLNGALGISVADFAFLLYGASVSIMWLRTLLFVMVHRDLGQFVRVLTKMTRDLTSFSVVWCIFILTFGTAMLGTGILSPKDEGQPPIQGDSKQPMQDWKSWWFVRTYSQSMGHDYMDEMSSHGSNVVFLVMWPVFNVLLVNLLIAVVNDQYENSKALSNVDYCFNLYEMYQVRTALPLWNHLPL
jgi:hypothetical protein